MKFSELFRIKKSQAELDFVDIELEGDIPLFLDPYAFAQRDDDWSYDCNSCIVDYFQKLVDHLRHSEDTEALNLLIHLSEPNETRLGLSKNIPQGRGIANKQAHDLYTKIKDSSAVKTGLLRNLEECELYIKGVARDKISDLTTNLIRFYLIQYTRYQCDLHNVSLQRDVASGFYWDNSRHSWQQDYLPLPTYGGKKILLTPKAVVRYDLAYDHREYYDHFVVNFLQAEHFADGSLVRALKSGELRLPYKKDIKARYPLSKEYIYTFTKEHPDVLERYKNSLSRTLRELTNDELEVIKGNRDFQVGPIIDNLIIELAATPSGVQYADKYHDIIIGALEIIFYPKLTNPRREDPIHEGRKRIDITYLNAAKRGFFKDLDTIHRFPCPKLIFEGKNYTDDPRNPELDQLQGRFSRNLSMVGFLVCRDIKKRQLFLKRCKDIFKDERGIVIPLVDKDIVHLLEMVKRKQSNEIDRYLDERLREVLHV